MSTFHIPVPDDATREEIVAAFAAAVDAVFGATARAFDPPPTDEPHAGPEH